MQEIPRNAIPVENGNSFGEFRQASHGQVFFGNDARWPSIPIRSPRVTMLSSETFLQTIDATPLVAIDLIIPNEHGAYLLGHRVNKPAQGFWFVPGGRIRKNERLDDAFQRIARDELGHSAVERIDADLLGVYEHLYEDNFSGQAGISTHYVVLGYRLRRPVELDNLPNAQHTAYRWATREEIVADSSVHLNTRAYFG